MRVYTGERVAGTRILEKCNSRASRVTSALPQRFVWLQFTNETPIYVRDIDTQGNLT